MNSWWQLGENSGHSGTKLSIQKISCPFCMEKGNFGLDYHAEKNKPNSTKQLNFDTLQCGSCHGYVMVLWSVGEHRPIHDYRVLPWSMKLENFPENWPEPVGRHWLQARRNVQDENWDAAAVMARSSLQAALRVCNARGGNLKQEIDDLASKGVLPPIMKEWSDQVRELGNDATHPTLEQNPTNPQDACDIVEFLDFLLEYLFSLPHQIQQYRDRGRKSA